MPRNVPWSQSELDATFELSAKNFTAPEIAVQLVARGFAKRTVTAIRNVLRRHRDEEMAAEARPVVDESYKLTANRNIEDLLAAQVDAHRRKMARHNAKKQGISITRPNDLPYGLVFFGDPHLGDPGCNITRLIADLEIVQATPGLHALNMGDLTNNWVGSLARLYGTQETTADEEEEMIRWLLKHDWLAVILGNHDKWAKVAELLCKEAKVPYVSHGSVFNVHAGDSVLKIDARHTHRGHSMYNPSHGQLKQNHRGSDAHIIIGAHTHVSAYTMLRNGVSGHLGHAIRVGSYKEADEYADANGFAEDTIAPSCMAVVRPDRFGEVDFVQIFWNIEAGADYLTWLRGEA